MHRSSFFSSRTAVIASAAKRLAMTHSRVSLHYSEGVQARTTITFPPSAQAGTAVKLVRFPHLRFAPRHPLKRNALSRFSSLLLCLFFGYRLSYKELTEHDTQAA